MTPGNRERSQTPMGPLAAYGPLLSQTRATGTVEQAAREAWFADLDVEEKHDLLFELEVLLKGMACFANPRNHPGRGRAPAASTDFTWHLAYLRDGLVRTTALAQRLLGDRARVSIAPRYLPLTLPTYADAVPHPGSSVAQRTPDESLLALRQSMTHALAVAEGALRLQRVPFRVFYALSALIRSEVAQNDHFNPLAALEFRPEFDAIEAPELLRVTDHVPGHTARGLVALTFVALSRLLRYATMVVTIAKLPPSEKRQQAGRIYLTLAVARSDARALSVHLQKRGPMLLRASFEGALFAASAAHLRERADGLHARGRALVAVQTALSGVASGLTLQMRKAFERDIPAPDAGMRDDELLSRLGASASELAAPVRKMLAYLAKALGGGTPAASHAPALEQRREESERLRRDVWMLTQIVRAFATKAGHAASVQERWATASRSAFVHEFVAYFQALGLPLLALGDYPRLDALTGALRALETAEALEAEQLDRARAEVHELQSFLTELFEQVSTRDELRDVPFDRRPAAATLRRYLND